VAVFFVETSTRACAYVRCELPARALARLRVGSRRANRFMVNDDTGLPDGHERFPTWVFQIPSGGESEIQLVKALRRAGKKIVVEFDDDYFHIPPGNKQLVVDALDPEQMRSKKEIAKLAHVITVSTKELIPIYQKFCDNVVVLPNCIDMADYPKPMKKGKRLTIGWAGAQELGNFSLVASTLKQMVEEFSHVDIAIGGDPKAYDLVKVDKARKTYLEPCSIGDFPKMINHFDIAVIPLKESAFNAGKSELKGLQYGALNIPFLASNVPPYRRFSRMAGSREFLIEKEKHWLPRLRNLVVDRKLRSQLGNKAYKVAESRQIDNQIGAWIEAYDPAGIGNSPA